MRAVIMHAPGDVRVDEVPAPQIVAPTDAVIRLTATCICGSDLWYYRGENPVAGKHMGHEYVGVVIEVGDAVTSVQPGDHVIGSFAASDNSCEICAAGYQSRCVQGEILDGMQAEYARVPLADGTLVKLPGEPAPEVLPSLLAASDVLGTGWFGALAAEAGPGKSVAVIGDGAVGLSAVLAAKLLGAERIIAMSRHPARQALAREFGATHVVEERGEAGIERVKELTGGLGAHSAVEAVGTDQAMAQAIGATRPGGHVGFVGVPHGVSITGGTLFTTAVHVHGAPAPVRDYLPDLVGRIWRREIEPGRVFDLVLPLDEAAAGYAAMDRREAVKVMLTM